MGRSEQWLRYSILAAQREGNRFFAALLAPMALTPSQAEVLAVVRDFGPLHLRRLGDLLICETGSPSRLVASLVTKGLLERDPDPGDVRRVIIALTEAGVDAAAKVRAAEEMLEAVLAERIGDDPGSWDALVRRLLDGTASGRALHRRGLWPEAKGDP